MVSHGPTFGLMHHQSHSPPTREHRTNMAKIRQKCSNRPLCRASAPTKQQRNLRPRPTPQSAPCWRRISYVSTTLWEGAALRRALRAAQGMRGVDFRASLHCGVSDPRFHLVYFPTRGLAEVSRLVLAEAAVPYTYECIGADLWTPQLKRSSPSACCPCSPTLMAVAVSFATRR